MKLKLFKLLFHQKNQQTRYAGEDLALSPKDFPFLKENDVIEIYNPDDADSARLLLKVTKGSLKDDFPQKDAISIEQSIGPTFQLKAFTDVIVQKVDCNSVAVDSLEVVFKDQYLGRSEMWRLKNALVNECVYVGKKLEYCSSTIRCQVHELWSGGATVSSGLVVDSTKIVFRSSTSLIYLFIQMSSEMWEFDIYGDLYYEKAVNGFLAELFAKWKKNGSNHEVTIVLFSRVYYIANAIDQFPEGMRECLLTDYRGRFYEDFYRIVVQNEKYDDWRNTLINLRRIFVDYNEYLLNSHKRQYPDVRIPKAVNSSAAQGNFLEVLNMSLNVFEKHYIDRSFDRTGQLSVVITPGVGVFEVDRELTNVTMQRVIDNGVGSDLVCIGEQPLHAVPLLKFHNKAAHQNNVDDYSMPHWINLSFYSTNKRVGYATYVPRIKLPTHPFSKNSGNGYSGWKVPISHNILALRFGDESSWPNSVYDFDSYDDGIFKHSNSHVLLKTKVKPMSKPANGSEVDLSKIFLRQNSEPEMHQSLSVDSTQNFAVSSQTSFPSPPSSSAIMIPSKPNVKHIQNLYSTSFGALNIELKHRGVTDVPRDAWFCDDLTTQRPSNMASPSNKSSNESPKEKDGTASKFVELRRPSRSLINPFDPSQAVIKLTSNRRRWTHIFPRGPSGTLIQQHHYPSGLANSNLEIVPEGELPSPGAGSNGKNRLVRNFKEFSKASLGARMLTRLWGCTGDQPWTPALTTGVDWKSLTIPACLPLTTDYFPDEKSLDVDYLVSDYSLLPDDVNADYSSQRAVYRRPLTTKEVFAELVSQRLAQGFQEVVVPKVDKLLTKSNLNLTLGRLKTANDNEVLKVCMLSIGRIFHKISLSGSNILVTRYRPRHPYPSIKIHYMYRFHAPNSNSLEVSFANFSTEKLENYNWNYLDHYICTRGDRDFALTENLKYWRFRMFILPINQAAHKKITGENGPCNVYTPFSVDEKRVLIVDFMKFIETCINRIRRPNNSVPKGARGSSGGSQGSGGFRERVNSNQLTERPRIRSGPKLSEKHRQESGSGRVSPLEFKNDLQNAVSDPFIDLQNPLPPLTKSDSQETTKQEVVKLATDATYCEIIAAMRLQKTGFSFIKSSDLPHWTFVSYDAVIWLTTHMEGIVNEASAVKVFNGMLREKLILHASRDSTHDFVNGFYLYYIVTVDADGLSLEYLIPHGDSAMFHNEWMEVEVPCQSIAKVGFLDKNMTSKANLLSLYDTRSVYKDVYVDVDVGKKSDRQEWGHVRYQSVYKPDEAFEIAVQWIQATGVVINDLVQSWSRKAQQCNLQLIPIPTDPFALPQSNNSDPLRGPISVELNTMCLIQEKTAAMLEDEWKEEIMLFQHHIALQFGFVRCPKQLISQYGQSQKQCSSELHYVHSSGNAFMIVQSSKSITQAGFLWSWNYMVSKRWRTSSTPILGDDSFMIKLLRDFQQFCQNEGDRLTNAWKIVKAQ